MQMDMRVILQVRFHCHVYYAPHVEINYTRASTFLMHYQGAQHLGVGPAHMSNWSLQSVNVI